MLAQRRPGLVRYLRYEDELMAVVSAFLEHVSLASGTPSASYAASTNSMFVHSHCKLHCSCA